MNTATLANDEVYRVFNPFVENEQSMREMRKNRMHIWDNGTSWCALMLMVMK
jgi:hypothetical protein